MQSFVKKSFRLLFKCAIIGSTTLFIFEVGFRFYVIDFYGYAINGLNEGFRRVEDNDDLLLIGDSFTAFKEGYASFLNDHLTSHNTYNASVSGTNIREQYLFGKHKLKQLSPDVLIFQYYVGNDLFSWDHPVRWSEASMARNLYWQISEHLWCLNYLNQRLAVLRSSSKPVVAYDFLSKDFSPDFFTGRDKLYYRVEPMLIENSVYLKEGRAAHLEDYLSRVRKLFAKADSDCHIYVLVIPHASQVSHTYNDRTIQLGAVFSKDFEVGTEDTPLTRRFQSFFKDDSRVKLLNPITFLKTQEEMGIRTYFNNDNHLNFEGQRLIGEYLLQNIQEGEGID